MHTCMSDSVCGMPSSSNFLRGAVRSVRRAEEYSKRTDALHSTSGRTTHSLYKVDDAHRGKCRGQLWRLLSNTIEACMLLIMADKHP